MHRQRDLAKAYDRLDAIPNYRRAAGSSLDIGFDRLRREGMSLNIYSLAVQMTRSVS